MTITDLYIYPVKSLAGIRVDAARVSPRGLEHDRRWMVVRPDGRFVTQRQVPGLSHIRTSLAHGEIELRDEAGRSTRIPLQVTGAADRLDVVVWKDEVEAVRGPVAASEWLSDRLGESLELVWMHDDARRAPDPAYSRTGDLVSFADGYPLLLTGEASLAELNRSLESPVPMTRFRPNAVVSTGVAWQEETWRSVTIGRVGLDVAKPCGRCVVTTVPQALDDRPPGEDRTEPLKTLSRMHTVNGKAVFGVNLIPRTDGILRIGDELRPHTSVMGR